MKKNNKFKNKERTMKTAENKNSNVSEKIVCTCLQVNLKPQ